MPVKHSWESACFVIRYKGGSTPLTGSAEERNGLLGGLISLRHRVQLPFSATKPDGDLGRVDRIQGTSGVGNWHDPLGPTSYAPERSHAPFF